MFILMVHNYYQSKNPSGENISFEAEVALLRQYGHQVITYTRHNDEIDDYSFWNKLSLPAKVIYSRDTFLDLKRLINEMRPDIAHFQNTFPLISPHAYKACVESGVPVVQTLRNYRLLCPNAQFYRNERVCEDCQGKTLRWPAVLHACYRESRFQTAAVAAMVIFHHWLKTWYDQVDIYIALTEFVRKKFVEDGFPADKFIVKPNFIYPDPGACIGNGNYALFVGRLSPEKGVRTLLQSWQKLKIPLKIVGDGPLMDEVRKDLKAKNMRFVELLGLKTHQEIFTLIKGTRFLVFPSELYETFGRVSIEAFACGKLVIASRLGAMAEIVDDGKTGLLFEPGNPDDLASKVRWLIEHEDVAIQMGKAARAEFEARYTAEKNYEMLMKIYEMAIRMNKCRINKI